MSIPIRFICVLALPLALIGCERAHRYPPMAKNSKDKAPVPPSAIVGWIIPAKEPRDLPIEFIDQSDPRWQNLPTFWNLFPPPAAGTRTAHLGLSPMQAAIAMAVVEGVEKVLIKVPRGLPPVPHPQANPPTVGKWALGKKLFFSRILPVGRENYACADCHRPESGFTERRAVALDSRRNTLSLINSAFNTSQFWDGRSHSLEEVVFQSVAVEARVPRPLESHRWSDVARRVNDNEDLRYRFHTVFGVERPTHDGIAKALATYMRTILSGNSPFDRLSDKTPFRLLEKLDIDTAAATRLDEKAVKWMNASFEPPLDKESLARKWREGVLLFVNKGCVGCHSALVAGGPKEAAYHNILIGDSEQSQAVSGKETGRFAALPIGLKDPKMRGAYRAPALRNLSQTGPYFHDGSRQTLREVLDYYNLHLNKDHPRLAEPLRDLLRAASVIPGRHPSLFTETERDSLLVFLLSLDGEPVDSVVAVP